MHMTSENRVRAPVRIIANTNKCTQLISVPVGYARKSTTWACKVYVVHAQCFTVYPPI